MLEIISIISLFVGCEIATGIMAFKTPELIRDGHGNSRRECKNPECGGFGDGWGSLGGFCVFCKHNADVGCKCILNGCGEIYWSKTMAEKKLANARGRES